MTKDQRTVAIGAVSGVASMVVLVWLLSSVIEQPVIPDNAADRLAYAARWLVVAVLPLFAMFVTVGNARFFSAAIDPTLGKEDKAIEIGRAHV